MTTSKGSAVANSPSRVGSLTAIIANMNLQMFLYLTLPHKSLGSSTSVPMIPETPSGVPVDSMCMECNGTLDSVDVHFVVGVAIYGNTGKYASVIYHLELIFDSVVCCMIKVTIYGNTDKMSIVWSEWPYQQTCKCYISFGTIVQCEFNGDVCFVIRVTTYGNWDKEVSQDIVKVEIQSKEVRQCPGQDPGQYSIFKL